MYGDDLGGNSVSTHRISQVFSPSSRNFPSTPSKEYYNKRSSAPVNVPSNRQTRLYDHDHHVVGTGGDDDDEIVPPHEYIARRLARTQLSSFSVCEGIGRKLKGRDLSQVRNDVLRKTGFLET